MANGSPPVFSFKSRNGAILTDIQKTERLERRKAGQTLYQQ
jgi:hypothetical protein